jgi:peptidoglycan hydrolase-like protein with peptidoglycan-binding domain
MMSDQELGKPLQRGNQNGQVKLIQEWLSLHGEHIAIDGDFGPATQAAVREFQGKVGLAMSGVVDAKASERLI